MDLYDVCMHTAGYLSNIFLFRKYTVFQRSRIP